MDTNASIYEVIHADDTMMGLHDDSIAIGISKWDQLW